jgi:two-component system cell cycle response regulator
LEEIVEERRKKVLIVDDEETILLLFKRYVNKEGYQAQSAETGQEALEKIKADPPDLILLDVMMPDMNGYEACRVIREIPGMQKIPIFIVTALKHQVDSSDAIESGATDVLVKPISEAELMKRVKRALGSPFKL